MRIGCIVVTNALQYHHMPKSAATATFVHVYDGTLNITSRTAGQVAWFLCAQCMRRNFRAGGERAKLNWRNSQQLLQVFKLFFKRG